LKCHAGITKINIIGAFLVLFTSASFSAYNVFILIFFLEDKYQPFAMKPAEALSAAAELLFFSFPFCIITSFGSGWIFGKFGRRKPIFTGYLIGVLGASIVPFVAKTIIPGVYFCLVLIQVGATITLSSPLLVDCF
jgi:MFS family permease